MSVDDNKSVIRSFVKGFEAGNLELLNHITTDDFSFTVMPTSVASGTYDKEKWLQRISEVLGDLAAPMTLQLGDFTAEDDRVSVTMVGNLPFKSGKVFASHYHLLFWLRDGKISAAKEYLDTYQVGEVFGFPTAAA
jgi:uncharacterized protein